MEKRTIDEMISYFNQEVSKMDISQENKMALLGMITAIGYESKKQEVVRCKECKYFGEYCDEYKEETQTDGMCDLDIKDSVTFDWFCADGKRREDDA